MVISEIGRPYVVRTSLNNGIRGYINEDEQYLNDGNTISLDKIQPLCFIKKSHILLVIKLNIKNPKAKTSKVMLIFITTMTKSFSSFSWGSSSFNVSIIENRKITLPTQNKTDYETMGTLISAIQKLVIKDVVLYADQKLEATKTVLNR